MENRMMKHGRKCLAGLIGAAIFPGAGQVWGNQAITPGDVVIYRVGDGVANLANTGNAVFLDEYTPGGALVQSIALPVAASAGVNPVSASGTATSEGLMSLSTDGHYLVGAGYAIAPGTSATSLTSSAAATVNRVVFRVDTSTGAVDTSTAFTDFADANNPRSVASVDGSSFYLGGAAGGVRYGTYQATTSTMLAAAGTSPNQNPVNIRQVGIAGGNLYLTTASAYVPPDHFGQVGTGLPTTAGQTVTALPGIPTSGNSPYSYFFADESATVAGLDTVYIADDSGTAGVGGIQKYCLDAGVWTAHGVVTAASARGLTGAQLSTTNIQLFATTGASAATGGGSLYAFQDVSGFDGAITGAASTVTTLSGTSKEAFRGVAFVPEPSSLGLASLAIMGLGRRRRRA